MQIEQKKGLTTREAKMLILLAVVGFGAVMVMFVIIPLYNHLQDERDIYNSLAMERVQIENLLLTESAIRNNHAEAAIHHSELLEIYFNEAHNSEIGRMLTRLCEDHGLFPVNQRISDPVAMETGGFFYTVTVNMTLDGTYNELKNLLNTVERTGYLRISRVSFSLGGDYWNEIGRISLTFEVTMIRAD